MTTTTRELAHRRNDGLDIRLLWDSVTDRVTVALHDAKTGDGFEVEVRDGERALDVFHHPFAYAAFRDAAKRRARPVAQAAWSIPDGTVWTGPYAVTPGSRPQPVVVRVRAQGWTSVDFDIEHAYGAPTGLGRGSLPAAVFARRFDRIF